jgi:D-3-phosphoglycerate dehydrogenase
MHDSILPLCEQISVQATYLPQATPEEVRAQIGNYEGMIVRSKVFVDAAFLQVAPRLKWIGRSGSGMDNIDEQAAAKAGVQLFNAPEGNRDSVAEHTVGLILALLNAMPQADAKVKSGIWDRYAFRGHELMGKTVGLIGFGNVGRAVASRLAGFQCRVLAYDKYLPLWAITNAIPATLEEIWRSSDILSLHIPLTAETSEWVNADFFSRFQKNIWLINTSRGQIIHLPDLWRALESGKVLGAALDVLDNEDFSSFSATQQQTFAALAGSGRVIFTPHVAGWTHESYERLNKVLIQKINTYLDTISK